MSSKWRELCERTRKVVNDYYYHACNNNNQNYNPTLTRFIPYDNYIGRRYGRTANESDECNCGCGKDEDIVSHSHNSLRVDNYIIGGERSQVFRLLLMNDSESWLCVCVRMQIQTVLLSDRQSANCECEYTYAHLLFNQITKVQQLI